MKWKNSCKQSNHKAESLGKALLWVENFLVTRVTAKVCQTGRLFLCFIIALRTNGITKSKASNT